MIAVMIPIIIAIMIAIMTAFMTAIMTAINSPTTVPQQNFAFLDCYLLEFDLGTIIISTASIRRFGWWYLFVKWSSGATNMS